MMHCILTTVRRYCPADEPSGHIYTINVEEQKITTRSVLIDPPYRAVDTNPRGGLRGGKGIAIREDQIAVANASMVFRYDPQWNLLGTITHPACAVIHEVFYEGESLWVTSTQTDLLMKFSLKGELERYYSARELLPAIQTLGWRPPIVLDDRQVYAGKTDFRDPSSHEKSIYDRSHLNSACAMPDGTILISLGYVLQGQHASLLFVKNRFIQWGIWPLVVRTNQILRNILGLKKERHSEMVIRPDDTKSAVIGVAPDGTSRLCLALSKVKTPSHSLLILPDHTVIYLNTTTGEVINFDAMSGETIFTVKVTDGFLRGAALSSENTLLLGSNGELITFDLPSRSVVARMQISNDPQESICDIKILPTHFASPPLSFEEHFEKQAGFKAEQIILNGYKLPV